jgi:hypothetical protein
LSKEKKRKANTTQTKTNTTRTKTNTTIPQSEKNTLKTTNIYIKKMLRQYPDSSPKMASLVYKSTVGQNMKIC